jgi:hypothetical protein
VLSPIIAPSSITAVACAKKFLFIIAVINAILKLFFLLIEVMFSF